ncbi:MAG: pentapeptide repeat-containing protein [Candidatus Dadabacteria bacterium]|nr:MAG: pentapeptide repeat-containing protein [Candidatus Dadabacteria bacterium]
MDAAGADLRGIDLSGHNLAGARLRYADLGRANLRGANLQNANLRHTRLVGADLRQADLRGADLSHADLHGALIGETRMEGVTATDIKGVRPEVFFPLPLLEELMAVDRVDLSEDILKISGDPVPGYKVQSAYRIVDIEAGDGDSGLVGKVVTHQELREQGGELAEQSLILGEAVYRCEAGYLGIPQESTGTTAAAPAEPPGAADDMDLLKDFLLKKLS